jgi:hypothetical protein
MIEKLFFLLKKQSDLSKFVLKTKDLFITIEITEELLNLIDYLILKDLIKMLLIMMFLTSKAIK